MTMTVTPLAVLVNLPTGHPPPPLTPHPPHTPGASTSGATGDVPEEERCLLTMSALTEDGIAAVKTAACDRLLNFRVEQKVSGKRISDVLNRMHVALPKPRAGAAAAAAAGGGRPPVIPPSVLAKRAAAAAAAEKRKTEKDLQEEHGGAGELGGCGAVRTSWGVGWEGRRGGCRGDAQWQGWRRELGLWKHRRQELVRRCMEVYGGVSHGSRHVVMEVACSIGCLCSPVIMARTPPVQEVASITTCLLACATILTGCWLVVLYSCGPAKSVAPQIVKGGLGELVKACLVCPLPWPSKHALCQPAAH
jgi:hypothetical protein